MQRQRVVAAYCESKQVRLLVFVRAVFDLSASQLTQGILYMDLISGTAHFLVTISRHWIAKNKTKTIDQKRMETRYHDT